MSGPDGFILADKPAGLSSHAVVARARRALGIRRIGHAGTLDPFATGLLILLVGRATRTQRWVMDLPKSYEVLAQLGARSNTGDPEGEITRTGTLPADPPPLPTGRLRQRPPAFSAVKIDGERAYARARRGEEVVTRERTIEVHSFEQLWRSGEQAAFRIRCSSGTYVRSLIADLGDAYCLELRRTEIGPFDLGAAWGGQGTPRVMGLAAALSAFLPVVELDQQSAARLAHGRPVAGQAAGTVLALGPDGEAVALAEPAGEGELKAKVGFIGCAA